MFTLAITHNWLICQIDISNVFLHGKLDKRIIVSQPFRFQDPDKPDYVCQLNKALYGLKQSPCYWFRHLREVLFSFGFTKSCINPYVFLSVLGSNIMFICVYVDDLIITGSSQVEVDKVILRLFEAFPIRNLGELRFFSWNSSSSRIIWVTSITLLPVWNLISLDSPLNLCN